MTTSDSWRWLLRDTGADSGVLTPQHLLAVVELITRSAPSAVACSVTELDGGTYRTSASSSPVALELDRAQYANGDGPCMTAARDRQLQQVRDTSSADSFRAFASAAGRSRIRSSLSVPIRTGYRPAALNLYARDADAFDERARAIADLVGRALTARLMGSPDGGMSSSEITEVAQRRSFILAAEMAVRSPEQSAGQAFEILARRSADERRSIFEVAADVAERAQKHG